MKIQTIWIISLTLLVGLSQSVNDVSFKRFCDNVGGDFVDNVVNNPDSWTPNTCTVRWPFPASNDNIATLHCKRWGAYPLESSKQDNGQPLCVYKNVYECRSDFTLIKGHCYTLATPSFVNLPTAVDICRKYKLPKLIEKMEETKDKKKAEVEVLRLFDPDLFRLIRAYFADLAVLFIQSEPALVDQITYNGGGKDMALVYGMASQYKTGPGSIIMLPNKHKAQVMCYYQAQETPMSFAHKAKMLEPYYYPLIVSGTSTFLRTVNHYGSQRTTEYIFEAIVKCHKSLRPLFDPSSEADLWDPTKENVGKMTTELKESFTIGRAPFRRCCESNGRNSKTVPLQRNYVLKDYKGYLSCDELPERDYNEKYSIVSSDKTCEFNEQATGYLFLPGVKNGEQNVYQVNTNHFAPQLCTLYYNLNKKPEKCEEGWIYFQRKNMAVCHKLFYQKKSFENANKHCQSLGGGLSTFTTYRERDIFMQPYKDHGSRFWIGLEKKPHCTTWEYGDGDCGKRKIVTYTVNSLGDESSEVRDLIGDSWNSGEPSKNLWQRTPENCIEMYGLLNDLRCDSEEWFMCIKPLTVYN